MKYLIVIISTLISPSSYSQFLGQSYLETITLLNNKEHASIYKVKGKSENARIEILKDRKNNYSKAICRFNNDTCVLFVRYYKMEKLQSYLNTLNFEYKKLTENSWLDKDDKNVYWSIKIKRNEFQLIQGFRDME